MIWRVAAAAFLTFCLAALGLQQPRAQFNGCAAGFCSKAVSGQVVTFNWANNSDDTTNQVVTTFNVGATAPAGANGTFTSGDFLFAEVVVDVTSGTVGTISLTGFTQITQVFDATQNLPTALYTGYKIAGGSETGSYAASWTNTSRGAAWALLDYGGVHNASPVDISGTQNNGFSANITAPSISPTGSADMMLCLSGDIGGSTPYANFGSMVARVTKQTNSSTRPEILIAQQQLSASGATGTRTATNTGTNTSMTACIALTPGP
jgi:hypothetical protein